MKKAILAGCLLSLATIPAFAQGSKPPRNAPEITSIKRTVIDLLPDGSANVENVQAVANGQIDIDPLFMNMNTTIVVTFRIMADSPYDVALRIKTTADHSRVSRGVRFTTARVNINTSGTVTHNGQTYPLSYVTNNAALLVERQTKEGRISFSSTNLATPTFPFSPDFYFYFDLPANTPL